MSLAWNAVRESFKFMKTYPAALTFMLAISVSLVLLSLLSSSLGEPSLMSPALYAGPLVIAAIASFVISLIPLGAFPVIVTDGLKRRKHVVRNAFKKSFGRIGGIFVATLITGLITMLPLVPALLLIGTFFIPDLAISGTNIASNLNILGLFNQSLGVFSLVLLAGFVGAFYFSARFWLIYPIMMLEGRGAIDSIKLGWRMSKGKVLSIWLAFVLLIVFVAVPGSVISFLVNLLSMDAASILWGVVYTAFAGAMGGVLTTIYYIKTRGKLRLK